MIKSGLKSVLGFIGIGIVLGPWYGVWISLAIIQIRNLTLYAVLVLLGVLGHIALLRLWLLQGKPQPRRARAWWIAAFVVTLIGLFLIYYLPQRWL